MLDGVIEADVGIDEDVEVEVAEVEVEVEVAGVDDEAEVEVFADWPPPMIGVRTDPSKPPSVVEAVLLWVGAGVVCEVVAVPVPVSLESVG